MDIGGDKNLSVTVKIEKNQVRIMFDSCSLLTIISEDLYIQNFLERVKLHRKDIRLMGNGGQTLRMHGYFQGLI